MKNKQKLGPRQLKWVEALEAHPERQTSDILGTRNKYLLKEHLDKTGVKVPYLACCLGESCLVRQRIVKKETPWVNDELYSYGNCRDSVSLEDTDLEYFSFYTSDGEILSKYRFKKYLGTNNKEQVYTSLAEANDSGVTWLQIAEFVRAYPQAVFKESK